MQSVLTYALEHPAVDSEAAKQFADRCRTAVDDWLKDKGDLVGTGPEFRIRQRNKKARLDTQELACFAGRMWSWELTEPVENGGEFRTTLQVATQDSRVVGYLSLKAGQPQTVVSPTTNYQVRPPRILQAWGGIPGADWRVGPTRVSAQRVRLTGVSGADQLIKLLEDHQRRVPVVVVSEDNGFMVHPDLDRELARELFGLAVVVSIDFDASWEMTRQLTAVWSCYHAGVRIYWPGMRRYKNPFDHWLWTADRIMWGQPDTKQAARRLTQFLFQEVRHLSTYSVRCPDIFPRIRTEAVSERLRVAFKDADSKKEFQQLAEGFAQENDQLRQELEALRAEIDRLRTDLENERLMQGSRTISDEPVTRATEAPPVTVQEAVERARNRFAEFLAFGSDVARGVKGLDEDAGPPDKVFRFLETLHDAARAMHDEFKRSKKYALGVDTVLWLNKKGAVTSDESESVMKNSREKQKRTWEWKNGEKALYHQHMKPSDGTDPAHCVRIYFAWCKDRKKFIVGWVGRHP